MFGTDRHGCMNVSEMQPPPKPSASALQLCSYCGSRGMIWDEVVGCFAVQLYSVVEQFFDVLCRFFSMCFYVFLTFFCDQLYVLRPHG